ARKKQSDIDGPTRASHHVGRRCPRSHGRRAAVPPPGGRLRHRLRPLRVGALVLQRAEAARRPVQDVLRTAGRSAGGEKVGRANEAEPPRAAADGAR
ncbi:hypothetical protein M885DRAFT_610393, partial [Pelagophyceae sp. CCMP2097]